MTAQIIHFPHTKPISVDPIDRLAALITESLADLPPADQPDEQLRLLRRIDQKLGQLMKVVDGGMPNELGY